MMRSSMATGMHASAACLVKELGIVTCEVHAMKLPEQVR